MIARAGVFDAQRKCHDAKIARWDHVVVLGLTPCEGQPSLAAHPLARGTAINNRSNPFVNIGRQSPFIEIDAISISIENFRNPLFEFLNMF